MHKIFTTVTSVTLLLLVVNTGTANAAKTGWEEDGKKLELLGDLRFRYEMDDNDSKSGTDTPNRTRERVRLRFGGVYYASDHIKAGFRLATGANDIHSPHQTLSDGPDEVKSLANTNFGTDKAYIKYKRDGWWAWAGKNSLPAKQLTKTWWEGDFNPGGLAIGYKAKYGDSKSGLSAARLVIRNNSHTAENDYGSLIGIDYNTKVGGIGLKLVLARFAVAEADRDVVDDLVEIPGGSAAYIYIGAQVKAGMFKLGTELYSSDVAEDERGGSASKSEDTAALVGYVKVKINDTFGVGYCYYDVGYASVPLLGTYGQDDFPWSSNFTGSKFQLDIDTGMGMKIDLRLYTQETKNEDITIVANSNAMEGKNKITRTQLNLNVPF
jgi:hypothetical protein